MSADEMFEKLGWRKEEDCKNGVSYYDFKDNEIGIYDYDNYGKRITIEKFEGVTMQELQAINKKCKELGWI